MALVVRSGDGKPFTVKEAIATRPGVSVTAERIAEPRPAQGREPEARPGDWRVVVALEASSGPRSESGEVVLTTDHPELAQLALPLRVRVRSLIEVLPPRVTLAHRIDMPRSAARVTLRHGALRRFKIESVRLDGVPGATARSLGDQAAATQMIEIALEGGALAPGRYEATLVIETSLEKKLPVVKVPVAIDVRGSNGPVRGS